MNADAKAIATRAQAPLEPTEPTTPMALLQQAVASGNIELAEKLMGLQERWEANQARKAFVEAFAAFKSEAITIVRNKTITDGPLKNKKYADLYSFVESVTPSLSKHGLSAWWEITKDDKDWIEVVCIIEHVLGGAKRVSFGGPPDTGGAKNALHARASTLRYLERYTFQAATGLAENDGSDDDGGMGRGDGLISSEQRDELIALADEIGVDKAAFCKHFNIPSLADILARDFAKAKSAMLAKRKAKAE